PQWQSSSWSSMGQGYAEMDFELHVHLRVGQDLTDHCAALTASSKGTKPHPSVTGTEVVNVGGCDVQFAVLIPVVQLAEDRQRMLSRVPSVIRLEPLDCCDRVWNEHAHFWEASTAMPVAPLAAASQDWE